MLNLYSDRTLCGVAGEVSNNLDRPGGPRLEAGHHIFDCGREYVDPPHDQHVVGATETADFWGGPAPPAPHPSSVPPHIPRTSAPQSASARARTAGIPPPGSPPTATFRTPKAFASCFSTSGAPPAR